MSTKRQFSEEDKKRISKAVGDLESSTSGELVPYYIPQSDGYDEAGWYLATLMGSSTLVIFELMYYLELIPFRVTQIDLAIAIFSWMVIGFFIPRIFPFTKRMLISRGKMLKCVSQKAEEVFLKEEVFNTGDRIGILLFISQLENMVIVLGDRGINEKLKASDWEHVVDRILSGIKNNRIVDGIVDAIGECKQILLDSGFENIAKDRNELSDDLRIGE